MKGKQDDRMDTKNRSNERKVGGTARSGAMTGGKTTNRENQTDSISIIFNVFKSKP